MSSRAFQELCNEARACTICASLLPLGPRPVFQLHPEARILIAGQAPGIRVHETGLPFNDASGDRLRQWLGVTRGQFYDPKLFAILPMGFCYPGTGKSGDLPPRPECAAAWRKPMLAMLANIRLTVLLGQHAVSWHLGDRRMNTLTATVRNWKAYWPDVAVLPHPSGRNNGWLSQNIWFETEILPKIKEIAEKILA